MTNHILRKIIFWFLKFQPSSTRNKVNKEVGRARSDQNHYEAWVKSKDEAIARALQYHMREAQDREAEKKEKEEKVTKENNKLTE